MAAPGDAASHNRSSQSARLGSTFLLLFLPAFILDPSNQVRSKSQPVMGIGRKKKTAGEVLTRLTIGTGSPWN